MALVAQVATRLERDHPGVRLRIHSGNGTDVIERVEKGLLDFGVVFGDCADNRFESLRLPHEDRWGVLMRQDHALARCESLTFEDLSKERLIVSGESDELANNSHTMFSHVAAQGYDIAATYTLLYNASLLVEAGMGVAICLDGIVSSGEGTPFSFVPLKDTSGISAHLIWKRYQPLSRAADALLRAMREM